MAIRGQRIARCSACRLPAELCVCAACSALPTRAQITVVMHRHEETRSTNTARLAVRMLEGARCVSHGVRDTPVEQPDAGPTLVLFPFDGAPVLRAEMLGSEFPIRLIVPDGTWSQARKIAQRWLARSDAGAVRLPEAGPSRYRLRCTDSPGALSTFEAIARAVGVIDGEANEAAMMRLFDELVARWSSVRSGGAREVG